jgi:hypothetical protein
VHAQSCCCCCCLVLALAVVAAAAVADAVDGISCRDQFGPG